MSTVDALLVSTNGTNGTDKKKSKLSVEQKVYVIDETVLLENPRIFFQLFGDIHIRRDTYKSLEQKCSGRDVSSLRAKESLDLIRKIIRESDRNFDGSYTILSPSTDISSGRLHIHESDKTTATLMQRIRSSHSEDITCILVTRDIDTILLAKTQGIHVDDDNDKRRRQMEYLMAHCGYHVLSEAFWKHHDALRSSKNQSDDGRRTIQGEIPSSFRINDFLYAPDSGISPLTRIIGMGKREITVENYNDYTNEKSFVFGYGARNVGQNVAMNLFLSPHIDCVIADGVLGSGKTTLAAVCALNNYKRFPKRFFNGIIYSRPIMDSSMGSQELGFSKGEEKEKLIEWMDGVVGAIRSILIHHRIDVSIRGNKVRLTWEVMNDENIIQFKDPNKMSGADYQNSIVIYDEFQNANEKLTDTMVSRIGDGKIYILGDNSQISEKSTVTVETSGLTRVRRAMCDYSRAGSVYMPECVRGGVASHYLKFLRS